MEASPPQPREPPWQSPAVVGQLPPSPLARSHRRPRVRGRVALQKPVPLTPSFGRACVRAVGVGFFKHAILFLL